MVKEKQFLEFGHYIIPKCDVKRVEKEFYKEKNIGTIYMKINSIYKKDDYEIKEYIIVRLSLSRKL